MLINQTSKFLRSRLPRLLGGPPVVYRPEVSRSERIGPLEDLGGGLRACD